MELTLVDQTTFLICLFYPLTCNSLEVTVVLVWKGIYFKYLQTTA